ncbi:hypothetical protein AAII07_30905 [Microvirga sp. 0TCS3.31]
MSEQLTSQSRSNESGISRRTALRGAAWSASAVTVVVATPNIAAASVTPTGSASGSASRTTRTAKVSASFKLATGGIKATGATPLTLTIAGGTLAAASVPSGWVALGTTSFRYGADVTAPALVEFNVPTPAINVGNNGNGHTMTLTFSSGTATLAVLAFPFRNKEETIDIP